MLSLAKDFNFSVGPLSIGGVLECIEYLFEGESFFGAPVLHFPHMPIRPRSDFLDDIEPTQNVIFYMAGIALIHGGI